MITKSEKYFGDIIECLILGMIAEIVSWICPANGMPAVAAIAMFTLSAISLFKWLRVRNTNEGNKEYH